MQLRVKVDLSQLKKGLKDVRQKQIPYATALALTATAGHVGKAWQEEMERKLDRPTPFTVNSVAVIPARKSSPTATVLLKDVAAAYLEPFVDGGKHFLGGKKGLLTPKNVPLNQYGNLTKNKIAQLKAKQNVFVGAVKLKSGQVVNGVWQRGSRGGRRKSGYGSKGSRHVKHNEGLGLTGYNNRAPLKLLVRFSDPQAVTQHLDFMGRAEKAILEHFEPEFVKAFAKAMASAK